MAPKKKNQKKRPLLPSPPNPPQTIREENISLINIPAPTASDSTDSVSEPDLMLPSSADSVSEPDLMLPSSADPVSEPDLMLPSSADSASEPDLVLPSSADSAPDLSDPGSFDGRSTSCTPEIHSHAQDDAQIPASDVHPSNVHENFPSGRGGTSPRQFQIRALPWKKILLGSGIFFAVLVLLLLITVWYLIASAPDIDTINVSPMGSATYICDENGNYLRKLTLAGSNRDIVSLDQIPENLQHAIVAIEDERFYEHGGIDLRGIARAFWTGISSGSFSEGASTITQQLIKNNVFTEWTQENSFFDRFSRKIQEQYLALCLEDRMEKDQILENYLNTINLGAGSYGVQAASRRYFDKDVSELTLSEAAVLAAIPQNPSGYDPIRYPEANHRRASIVLCYMEEQGYITADEHKAALEDDVYARIRLVDASYENDSVYSYYEDALIDQVMDTLISEKGYTSDQAYRAVYSGGLRIYSAQDSELQTICDEEFQNPANFPEGTQYGIDYALSIADENGLVTHYGAESLRTFIRQTENPSFQLLCASREEAQSYADAFREHLLSEADSVAEEDSDSGQPAGSEAEQDSDSGQPTGSEDEEDPSSGQPVILGERLTLSPQPQSSLVLIDQKTGLVRAVVGGRGEKTASLTLNRATDTTRQPGSTFKILTAYAPAIDAFGQTLATEYENEPYQYADGTPVSNWDITDYSGTVTIREAITRSINVIAVKCITEISPRVGFEYAKKFGISTLHESYETADGTSSDVIQPLALGGVTQGVTNLELCASYAAIANDGQAFTPRFFTKIEDRHGEVIVDYSDQTPVRVLKDSTAFLLTDAMRDVVSSESGTAYGSISASGQPVSGKTGTTSSYKDIWFVGYTPYYTCSVWGGFDNNQELPSGSIWHSYSKILWSAVMNRIHAELPLAEFEQPEDVTSVTLCRTSHLPAVAGACPETYTEYFAVGTEPEDFCPLHEIPPETEPITIYQDILDELFPSTEPITESESDASAVPPGSGSNGTHPGSPNPGPGESETHPDTPGSDPDAPGDGSGGSDSVPGAPDNDSGGSDSAPGAPDQPDTTSFDDLMNRLTGQSSDQTFRIRFAS